MANEATFRSLITGFMESVERFPARPALVIDSQTLSYGELRARALRIGAAILQYEPEPYPMVAVLASRSVTAYAAILGIHASGKGHVPLNPKFPVKRTEQMLRLSGCRILIADAESLPRLRELLRGIDPSLTVLLPDMTDAGDLVATCPPHRFVASRQMTEHRGATVNAARDSIAYLLFTSGSTGEPKGVPVSQGNVRSYVQYMCDRYEVTEQDRFSQEFELTFDLSMHDMFVCWERGACLFCVPEKSVMLPAKFIRDHQLTMWFSVPSVAGLLKKTRLLQPGCFPSLRYSLFCGEPLPTAYAQAWQEAAPNSTLENLYGPTETTIAIPYYRWDPSRSPGECANGIVPIGWIFEGQQACVIDSERNRVTRGESGELCLAGSQVTTGYWNNAPKTAKQFIRLPGSPDTLWYRTGDLVRESENGCFLYLGRLDDQVKIRGYRVELQEIEAALRQACGVVQAVAVPWPVVNGGADGVVAFVCGGPVDRALALSVCRTLLPDYMVPRDIIHIDELPLNGNGKVDRKRLKELLEGTTA